MLLRALFIPCLMVAFAAGAAAAVQPVVTFDDSEVVATGITAGGEVAWFGVGHAHEDDALHVISRHTLIVDDDKDGEVRLDVGSPIPKHSVWIAVDMESGQLAVAAPPGDSLRLLKLPAGAIHPGAAGASDLFEDSHQRLQVVVVRPGAGAWGGDVGDGGESDADGQGNGRLWLSLDELEPFDDSPELRPAVLKPGDVFAAVAIDSLETYAERLAGGPRGQGEQP